MTDPRALMAKTAEIAADYERLCALAETARFQIHGLSSSWISEGAYVYRSRFDEFYPKLTEIFASLKKRVNELNAAAGIMALSEEAVVSRAEELRTEYIFR